MKSVGTILIFCFSITSFASNIEEVYERNRREDRCVHINFWAGLATFVVFTSLGTAVLVPQGDFNMKRSSNSTNSTMPTYDGHQSWSLGVGIPFALIGTTGFAWMVGSVVTGFRLGTCLTPAGWRALHQAQIAH